MRILASCHWPPTTLFFFLLHLNVVLHIASCTPFGPCLTGDVCTAAFSRQERTLSSYDADDMHSRFKNDLQQITAVQQEATVAPPAPPLSHLNPLN